MTMEGIENVLQMRDLTIKELRTQLFISMEKDCEYEVLKLEKDAEIEKLQKLCDTKTDIIYNLGSERDEAVKLLQYAVAVDEDEDHELCEPGEYWTNKIKVFLSKTTKP